MFYNKRDSEICKNIRIEIKDSINSPFMKSADVERSLAEGKFRIEGLKMCEINTLDIANKLLENKIIKEAACYKTPGGTLRIDIYQRRPILRVMSVSGNYYIDDVGYAMPVSNNFVAYLPVVTGYVTEELRDNELFEFAKFLQNNKFWNKQIDQIHITSNGEVELIPKVGSQTIILGDFSNFEKKLANLKTFYHNAIPRKGWDTYKAINLKYENQVIGVK